MRVSKQESVERVASQTILHVSRHWVFMGIWEMPLKWPCSQSSPPFPHSLKSQLLEISFPRFRDEVSGSSLWKLNPCGWEVSGEEAFQHKWTHQQPATDIRNRAKAVVSAEGTLTSTEAMSPENVRCPVREEGRSAVQGGRVSWDFY